MKPHDGRCVPSHWPPGSQACLKCGRRCPDPEARSRDDEAGSAFVREAMELAERLTSLPVGGYLRRVRQRWVMGDEEYGTAFLDRDCLPDLLEETPDLASWAALELQRLRDSDAPTLEDDRMDLMAVAMHGAIADAHALNILRRRQGGE